MRCLGRWAHLVHVDVDRREGDPKPGDALILKANPEMTQDVLDQARVKMNDTGLIESGDAISAGIGTMSNQRWEEFYKMTADNKVYPAGMDYKSAYTLDYVPLPKQQ